MAVSSVCVYRTKAFQQNKIFLIVDVVPAALYAEDLRGPILFVLYSAPRYWQLFEISFVKLKECFMNYVFFSEREIVCFTLISPPLPLPSPGHTELNSYFKTRSK